MNARGVRVYRRPDGRVEFEFGAPKETDDLRSFQEVLDEWRAAGEPDGFESEIDARLVSPRVVQVFFEKHEITAPGGPLASPEVVEVDVTTMSDSEPKSIFVERP